MKKIKINKDSGGSLAVKSQNDKKKLLLVAENDKKDAKKKDTK